jgi:hypothetical protein
VSFGVLRISEFAWLGRNFSGGLGLGFCVVGAFSFGSVVRLMVDGFGVSDRFNASDDSVER